MNERLRQVFWTTLFTAVLCVAFGHSQSKATRLTRPCPATTTRAVVEIKSDGDVSIVPCPGRSILANGVGAGLFDIRSYGAVLDDANDDSAAVKAATDAAISAGGGIIYFPRGTTRIAAKFQSIPAGTNSNIVYQGESGASRVLFYRINNDRGISLSAFGSVTFRDLVFIGESAAGLSVDSNENTGPVIVVENVFKTIFERCFFLGIKSLNGAVIYTNLTQLVIRDSFFGACTAPNAAVVDLEQTYGATFDNVAWYDYHQYNGVFYNKLSVSGNTASWVRSYNPAAVSGASQRPMIVFKGVGMDENNTNSLVNLTGTNKHSVLIEDSSFASGFGGSTALKFATFREVIIRNSDVGLSLNTTDHRGALFTDIGVVRLENYQQKYGAKWITLAGTTGKLVTQNATFQGNGTYPTGVQNTAGAVITNYE